MSLSSAVTFPVAALTLVLATLDAPPLQAQDMEEHFADPERGRVV
jgi:hypothetical protein